MIEFKPGDVIAVGTRDKAGWWIRLRSKIQRQPSLANHVAMFTHYDSDGTPRGLEGRPSAFGWVNLEKYAGRPFATNAGRTSYSAEERWAIVNAAHRMVGISYDWAAIVSLGLDTLGREFNLAEWPEEGLPSHVTCASALDMLYEGQGWDNPGGWRKTRGTDPDDWVRFLS